MQPAPVQDSVFEHVRTHPGATMNDIFHDVRKRDPGVTYEGVRMAIGKLLTRNRIRKERECETYLAPLYVVEST